MSLKILMGDPFNFPSEGQIQRGVVVGTTNGDTLDKLVISPFVFKRNFSPLNIIGKTC